MTGRDLIVAGCVLFAASLFFVWALFVAEDLDDDEAAS